MHHQRHTASGARKPKPYGDGKSLQVSDLQVATLGSSCISTSLYQKAYLCDVHERTTRIWEAAEAVRLQQACLGPDRRAGAVRCELLANYMLTSSIYILIPRET